MKILPITKPQIVGNLFDAFPLSVASNHSDFTNWFYSNPRYASLSIYKEGLYVGPGNLDSYENYLFDQKTHPLLNSYIQCRNDLKVDIIDFIKETLNSDRYIYLFIDEFYNPNSREYSDYAEIHEILVRGYDDATNELHYVSFTNENIYNTDLKIKYTDLRKCFYSKSFEEGNIVSDHQFNIITLKTNKGYKYITNYEKIIHSLNNYLNPREDIHRAEGIAMYIYFCDHVSKAIENNNISLLLKPFHILYEHKKHTNNLLMNFCENMIVKEHEETILKNSIILRNYILRCVISGINNSLIETLQRRLEIIFTSEPVFIVELRKRLIKINNNL